MPAEKKAKPGLGALLERASAEQRAYIDDAAEPATHTRLLATAGSGKTFSIIARAWNMIAGGALAPDEVVVLTFSRQARHDFVRKVVKAGAPLLPRNVRTIDSFARQAIDPHGRVDVSILSYSLLQFLRDAAPEEARAAPGMGSLRHLFVDEAQDLNATQYGVVMALADKLGVGVSMVGDPNQNIYQFRGGSDAYLRGFPAARTYSLTHNYRSARHVVEYAGHLRPYQEDEVRWTRESPVEGARVALHGYERGEGLERGVLGVIERLRERGVPLHKIAVLAPTRGAMNADGRHRGLCHVANILALAGIPATQLYDDSGGLDADGCAEGGRPVDEQRGALTLMTYTASKGLEWDYVLLVDAHAYLVGRAAYTRARFEAERYLLYVAATRARKALHIFAQRGQANPWLAHVPTELYRVAGDPERLSFTNVSALQFAGEGEAAVEAAAAVPGARQLPAGAPGTMGATGDAPPGAHVSTAVYALGERELYEVDGRFRWALTCTQLLTDTAAQVPQGRARFLARLARIAFLDAYDAALGAPPEPLRALAAALDETRVVVCEDVHAAQWHMRNRDAVGWDAYDRLRAQGRVPRNAALVLDALDRAVPLHEYTLVSDKFYRTHITARVPALRVAYEAYTSRAHGDDAARVPALFELAALDYALATTHYFYAGDPVAAFGQCACAGNIEHLCALRVAAGLVARDWPARGPRVEHAAPRLHGTVDLVDPRGRGLLLQFASGLRLQDVLCAAVHQALMQQEQEQEQPPHLELQFAVLNLSTGALQEFSASLPRSTLDAVLGSPIP